MAELTRLQQLQERYRQEKLTLYESYIAGDCSKERYLKKKAERLIKRFRNWMKM